MTHGLVPMLIAAFAMGVPDAALGTQRMMEICGAGGERKVIVVAGDPSAPQDTPHCERKACHAACQRKTLQRR